MKAADWYLIERNYLSLEGSIYMCKDCKLCWAMLGLCWGYDRVVLMPFAAANARQAEPTGQKSNMKTKQD